MIICRFAREADLARINELRKEVNDLHVKGRPDRFKPGFEDVSIQLYEMWSSDEFDTIVAESEGTICGMACVKHVVKSETPFTKAMRYDHVDEFCVASAFRRQGVATALMEFIRDEAKKRDVHKVELNVWSFNEDAEIFYESVGFKTYRKLMEWEI